MWHQVFLATFRNAFESKDYIAVANALAVANRMVTVRMVADRMVADRMVADCMVADRMAAVRRRR